MYSSRISAFSINAISKFTTCRLMSICTSHKANDSNRNRLAQRPKTVPWNISLGNIRTIGCPIESRIQRNFPCRKISNENTVHVSIPETEMTLRPNHLNTQSRCSFGFLRVRPCWFSFLTSGASEHLHECYAQLTPAFQLRGHVKGSICGRA